jgi:hypothetical protein
VSARASCAWSALALLLALVGCSDQGETALAIDVHNADDAQPIQVFLSAGTDRRHFASLGPGQREHARLRPGSTAVRADERRLHVRFVRAGQSHEWLGPDLPSDAEHRIALELHADGRVESRQCLQPCTLD